MLHIPCFWVHCLADENLTLAEAIRIALLNNPAVLVAQKESEAASARILQAEAIANLELGITWSETPSKFNLAEADERSIGFVQSLEFPGKRRARRNVASLEFHFFKENVERAKLLVSAEVKKAYYQAWLNNKLITNFEFMANLLQQFRETATMRYQLQQVPFLEVLRAKTELTKINNDLIAARRETQNSLAELNRLLGRPGSLPIVLADDFSYQPFGKSLETVLNERGQISAARRMSKVLVERSQAQLRLAQKSYLPDFSVGLFNQNLKEQPPFNANQFFGTRLKDNWQIEVGLSIPLWFWKGPQGEARAARTGLELAQIQDEVFNRNAITAIETAYRSVKACEEQLRLFEDSLLRDVDDELHTGISHYQNGRIDALDLIDIYRTYTITKAEYYRALFNYYLALADLEVAGESTLQP